MTTFYLVRHADKASDGDVITGRAPGVLLSERGQQQAEELAEQLASEPIRHIYASPLERARQTAQPLARMTGLAIQLSHAIGEIDFGAWTNKTLAELAPIPQWQQLHRFRSGIRIPDGERLLEVQARFAGEMLRLCDAHPNEAIALFSHGDPIRAAVAYFAGIPLDLLSRIEISLASISVISIADVGPTIHRLNQPGSRPSPR